MRTLIAGVGYPFLRDGSLGPVLTAQLKQRAWLPHVQVEDYSFGPVAAVQRWQAMPEPFEKVVFFSAVQRGRKPGSVVRYQWDQPTPDPAAVQERVAEAVTGVISLDNLLIISRAFGVLPKDTVVVEVEPADQGWGPGFSPAVEGAIPEVIRILTNEAANGQAAP